MSQSSSIINFDAINQSQFVRARCNWHEKLAPESGIKFMAPVSGACVRGLKSPLPWLALVLTLSVDTDKMQRRLNTK